jgi:cellulose synthase/poly-beta-1,6-N-acetylglucosamine synthase-like glycosyltransferase
LGLLTTLAPAAAPPLLFLSQSAVLLVYALAQLLLVLYSSHRYLVLWRCRGSRPRLADPIPPASESWPRVTVQLPVFNERTVVERLIAAAAALDYPWDRLEIQVLDDSTDDTTRLAAATVLRLRAAGLDIRHFHRARRDGYKAGALAAGLLASRGELIAVFDADFVPPPDFLRRAVPRFAEPATGMVQARWGHLNRERSLLTRAQAVMIDSHFMLEHEARMRSGLFFNFNGTAGVWRRACIEDAGGWTHDTLTEDLDLSYRAQLRGWRFVFDRTLEAPAELPSNLAALETQQRRWAKGSIQTARKVLPRVIRSALPLPVKLEACIHLTGNVTYPLLVVLALLLLPVLLVTSHTSPLLAWTLQAGVLVFGVLPVTLFLAAGQAAVGRTPRDMLLDVPASLVLGVGLSLNNARAVLEGLGSRLGDWDRTPKSGEERAPARVTGYAVRAGGGRMEGLLALYFAGLIGFALGAGEYRAVPFMALLLVGFGAVGLRSTGGARWFGSRASEETGLPAALHG